MARIKNSQTDIEPFESPEGLDAPSSDPPEQPENDPAPGNDRPVVTVDDEGRHAPIIASSALPLAPSSYEITHTGVAAFRKGQRVSVDDLFPISFDLDGPKRVAAEKAREDGMTRLLDLGAITPVYE